MRDAILADLFLSIDYRAAWREPAEPVSYIAFADPYELGCANNLARYEL